MARSNQRLTDFVGESLRSGQTRDEIRGHLRAAGWHETQIDEALGAFAESASPVPVPRARPHISAAEAFFYLLLFSTLYVSAFYLGNLAFNLIDLFVADPAADAGRSQKWLERGIRFAVAILLVFFPTYLFLNWKSRQRSERDPAERGSAIRKWLGYLTLFIAALFVLGDLTGLIYRFLMGDLTLRIALKMLTVGVIAGGVFIYYLWDLRTEPVAKQDTGE